MSPIKNKDNQKKYWRSFDQLKESESYKQYLHREFQEGASLLEGDVTRRSFLKLMGASAALAGVTGCSLRRPERTILPYAKQPENVIPGHSIYYATSVAIDEEVVGLLGETQEGRPTKVEGNPAHSASLGATRSQHQASVLDLHKLVSNMKSSSKTTTMHAKRSA